MSKLTLPFAEFYLTNACNLDCSGCDALSNYKFSNGNQDWEQLKGIYQDWANVVDIDKIYILGGEPLLRPDCGKWVSGIRALWPNATIKLYTNGILLYKRQDLYQHCLDSNVSIFVSGHNASVQAELIATAHSWLSGPLNIIQRAEDTEEYKKLHKVCVEGYNSVKDASWPECNSFNEWECLDPAIKDECVNIHNVNFGLLAQRRFDLNVQHAVVDSNGVQMEIVECTTFYPNTIIEDRSRKAFFLHNNDAMQAHAACHQKTCHQFYNGQLYKCAPMHTFKEFAEQQNLILTSDQKALIESYQPGTVQMAQTELSDFIERLPNFIKQCSLCSASTDTTMIEAAVSKKIFFVK